jgi:hypothetical protein
MKTRRTLLPALVLTMLGLPGVGVLTAGRAQADVKAATANWQIRIIQIDNAGTMVGLPQGLSCPRDGCQTPINLDVEGKARRFIAIITFVKAGAYLGLQATAPALGKVIDFDKGFEGPIFIPLFGPGRDSASLNFILTGLAVSDSNQDAPLLMHDSQSLVFHRKMQPDLTLKIDFTPPRASS